jgi:hypothetical protein
MRSFVFSVVTAILLACLFALALNFIQKPVGIAFRTEGVHMVAAPIDERSNAMSFWDGAFGALVGAIIGGATTFWGSKVGAKMQVDALEKQSEAERARFQQTRHQKKYAMALALHLEAKRIGVASEKRIALAEASRSATRHPLREQMIIAVLPLIRGEREDIGLLGDDLQDNVLGLANDVDEYNSHIETIQRTAGDPISVDQPALDKLVRLREKATSVETELNASIAKVREWRCQRCKAFIDEVLDVSIDGQRKRCPICDNTTRIAGASASLHSESHGTFIANVIRLDPGSGDQSKTAGP